MSEKSRARPAGHALLPHVQRAGGGGAPGWPEGPRPRITPGTGTCRGRQGGREAWAEGRGAGGRRLRPAPEPSPHPPAPDSALTPKDRPASALLRHLRHTRVSEHSRTQPRPHGLCLCSQPQPCSGLIIGTRPLPGRAAGAQTQGPGAPGRGTPAVAAGLDRRPSGRAHGRPARSPPELTGQESWAGGHGRQGSRLPVPPPPSLLRASQRPRCPREAAEPSAALDGPGRVPRKLTQAHFPGAGPCCSGKGPPPCDQCPELVGTFAGP